MRIIYRRNWLFLIIHGYAWKSWLVWLCLLLLIVKWFYEYQRDKYQHFRITVIYIVSCTACLLNSSTVIHLFSNSRVSWLPCLAETPNLLLILKTYWWNVSSFSGDALVNTVEFFCWRCRYDDDLYYSTSITTHKTGSIIYQVMVPINLNFWYSLHKLSWTAAK